MRTKYLKTLNKNGQLFYQLEHPKFRAEISQFGGQLISFRDKSGVEWIWLSSSAKLDGSAPIRGGAPICWPWFGPAQDNSLPQHGYARRLPWQLLDCEGDDERVRIRFSCQLDQAPIDLSNLSLIIEYVLGDDITINLHTENLTEKTLNLSQAIHTYFNISDIYQCKLIGFEQINYEDKLASKNGVHKHPLSISYPVDRVYLDAIEKIEICTDESHFVVSGSGYDSVVLWNPWKEGAESMSDFDNDGFAHMICVEMANTQGLQVGSHDSHTLTQQIKRI